MRRALGALAVALLLGGAAAKPSEPSDPAAPPPIPLPWFRLSRKNAYALHLVTTRFSLKQGNLTDLTEARLALFQRVCLPTMAAQLADRFVWLIYTDTTLPWRTWARMRAMVRPWPHFHVLRRPPTDEREFGRRPREVLLNAKLWTPPPGAAELAEVATISTRLDADDGLASGAVAELQRLADERLTAGALLEERTLCGAACWVDALEWTPALARGLGKLARVHTYDSPDACTTPGLTAFGWENNRTRCTAHMAKHTRFGKAVRELKQMSSSPPIRTRSVTSNSMSGLGAGLPTASDTPAETSLRPYNLTAHSLEGCAQRLRKSTARIARDQLSQRCNMGFSCRESASKVLSQLAAADQPAGARPLPGAPAKTRRPISVRGVGGGAALPEAADQPAGARPLPGALAKKRRPISLRGVGASLLPEKARLKRAGRREAGAAGPPGAASAAALLERRRGRRARGAGEGARAAIDLSPWGANSSALSWRQ